MVEVASVARPQKYGIKVAPGGRITFNVTAVDNDEKIPVGDANAADLQIVQRPGAVSSEASAAGGVTIKGSESDTVPVTVTEASSKANCTPALTGGAADAQVVAVINNLVAAAVPIVVITPWAIENPNPAGICTNLVVSGKNSHDSGSTSPAVEGLGFNQVLLRTDYTEYLTITVADQFGNALSSIYAGAAVFEDGYNINQALAAGGTYQDPVGGGTPDSVANNPLSTSLNGVYAANDPNVGLWSTETLLPMLAGTGTQNYGISIGTVALQTGIINRIVQLTPPNTISVTW